MNTSQSTLWPPTIEKVFDSESKLPVLSPVALRVIQLSDDPSCDSRRLGDTLAADPGLSARLLKLANSSFYGYGGQVTNLQQAIVLLGFSTIRNVVLGLSVGDLFTGGGATAYLQNFWKHSFLTATLAFSIARGARHPNLAFAFTGGLLHNVGKLLALEALEERANILATTSAGDEERLAALESMQLGFNHAEAGAWMAFRWRFPDPLIEAIGCHHTPQKATLDPLLSSIVAVAASLAQLEEPTLPEPIPSYGQAAGLEEDMTRKAFAAWWNQRDSHLQTLEFIRSA